jgi:hypothetical protein
MQLASIRLCADPSPSATTRASVAVRRPWLCVAALIVAGAWPDAIFQFALPMLGQSWAEIVATAVVLTAAILIGRIGGKLCDWRCTTLGVLTLSAAIWCGTSLVQSASDSGFPRLATPLRDWLHLGAFQALVLLLPAMVAHVLTADPIDFNDNASIRAGEDGYHSSVRVPGGAQSIRA